MAEKRLLFWASFLSLTPAGVGFAFRVAMGGEYGAELALGTLLIIGGDALVDGGMTWRAHALCA